MTTFSRARRSWPALLLLAASACVCLGQASDANPAQGGAGGKVTTVFLVRHAERAQEPAQDPPLTEAGRARAETLARLLSGAGVKAVYASQYERTRQTAEPLAKLLGVPVNAVSLSVKPDRPREVSEQSIGELKSKVEAHAGEAVLIVGHTNSVPDLIRELGGDVVPTMDESMFDDLFVVTVYAQGRAKVVRLKYGASAVAALQETPPIRNFLWVNKEFCTGGQPRNEHLAKLKEEGVRAIINLRQPGEHRAEEEKAEAERLGLRYFNIPVAFAEPKEEQATEFLKLTDDAANRPAFVHCTGAIRVGAFWMIRRVLRDGWTIEDAEKEAEKIGLREAPHLNEFARAYIKKHRKQ